MRSSAIKYFNANPWRKNIPDCAVRAIVMAIGMKYELVCRKLGMAWRRGYGLVRGFGVTLFDIKKAFGEYFDVVQDFNEKMPPELAASGEFADTLAIDARLGVAENTSGGTLAEFLDLYEGQGTFLVGLVGDPSAKNPSHRDPSDGHIVCTRCLRGMEGFAIDTYDSSDMAVDAFMRVSKRVPKDSPDHWVYDKASRRFAGYGA